MKVTPALQAERILAAWASGDEPSIQQELQNSRSLAAAGLGLDEERLELLQAVSEGMLRSPKAVRGGWEDPALRRCLDLLTHLAKSPSA
jgi:hypothetical protein